MKKIGILGSGEVGRTLATGLLKHGYQVMIGSGTPAKLYDWQTANPSGKTGTFEETLAFGNLQILAVKGTSALGFVKKYASGLNGKMVIDVVNPIADTAPEDGVLRFFTSLDQSLMEQLQDAAPEAHFVKAFSCVGSPFMVNPPFADKPTMFICGNNESAKSAVIEILVLFGWEIEDMGTARAARAIEPLCMLWCIPGLREGRWRHAFKLLK